MANCFLAFPDHVGADGVIISGGDWTSELPLANLQRPELAYVARSSDLDLQSTRFWIDLGVPRDISGIFIPRCNGSRQLRYRIRGFTVMAAGDIGDFSIGESAIGGEVPVEDTAPPTGDGRVGRLIIGRSRIGSSPSADSGWSYLYRAAYPLDSLYWGHPSLWDGKIAQEDVAIYPMPLVEVFSTAKVARYWYFEFDDTTNADGYLEIPRIVMTSGYRPRANMDWGASINVEDPSVRQDTLGGGVFFTSRPKRRVVRFTLGFLSDDDGMTWITDMKTKLGMSGQIFFVHDSDDRIHMHQRSFLARMRTISPLEYTALEIETAPFELEEVVA